MTGVRMVYRRPVNSGLALASGMALWLLYLWSGQVLELGSSGVHLASDGPFLVAATLIAILFGVVVPLEVAAVRLAAAHASATGGTVLGALLGSASMTCCAPVILPSLLSVAGVSGSSILSINAAAHRFWLPLATLSCGLLAYSLVSVAQALESRCRPVH